MIAMDYQHLESYKDLSLSAKAKLRNDELQLVKHCQKLTKEELIDLITYSHFRESYLKSQIVKLSTGLKALEELVLAYKATLSK